MYAVVRLTRASQSTRWRPAAAWRLTEAAASASANHAQSICRGGHECATERATRTSSLREYAHLQHSRTFYSHSIWLHLRGRKRLTAGGDVDDGGSRSSSEATTAALPNHSREGTTTFAQEASVELQTPLPDSTLASSVCVNPSWSPSRAQELTQFDSSWRTGGSASSSPSYYHLALCARFFVFTIALSSARVWYEWVCHDECRPEECHSKRQLMEWTTTSLAHLRSGPQHWATLLTYALSHRSLDSLAANLAWVAAYSVGLGWRYGIVRTVAIGAASALAGGMTVCMCEHTTQVQNLPLVARLSRVPVDLTLLVSPVFSATSRTDSTSRVMGGSGVAFGLAAAYSATAVRDWTFTSFPHRVKLPFITAGIQVRILARERETLERRVQHQALCAQSCSLHPFHGLSPFLYMIGDGCDLLRRSSRAQRVSSLLGHEL